MKGQGIATGLNIVANLALIPLLGGIGAAIAALLSESVLGHQIPQPQADCLTLLTADE